MPATAQPPIIVASTIYSLLAVIFLLLAAYLLSLRLLPLSSPPKTRLLFIWHLFDALIHFLFEGSFLYHCFFTYTQLSSHHSTSTISHNNGGAYLGHHDRLYGAMHGGDSYTAKVWQEYAKADRRWGGADVTVISLELLTVFGAGPLAVGVCEMLRRGSHKVWFWASVLATAELYGGESVYFTQISGIFPFYTSSITILILGCFHCRVHDVCSGMAQRQPQSQHKQLYVYVGLLVFLQHAVGLVAFLGVIRIVWQHKQGICDK